MKGTGEMKCGAVALNDHFSAVWSLGQWARTGVSASSSVKGGTFMRLPHHRLVVRLK